MNKKLFKSIMDTNKSKDSGDNRNIEKTRTSVINYINKGVSERGDSKIVFVNRIIEQKTDNKKDRTNADKKSNEVRIQPLTTQIDKSLKLDNKSNDAKLEKLQSVDRKQELVPVSTRKYDTQNTTKNRDIVKRSDGKEPFKPFPENSERRPPITIIHKDVKISRTEDLITSITKKRDSKNMPVKYNVKRSDANEMFYDKGVKSLSKQELATGITRKHDSQNMNITKKSTGKESTGNLPGNTERDRNTILNVYDKNKKMRGREVLVTDISSKKSKAQNMSKKAMHITIKLDEKESNKTYIVNDEINQNNTANVCDYMKLPSQQVLVNKLLAENFGNTVKKKNNITSFVGQQRSKSFSFNNECGRNINKDIKLSSKQELLIPSTRKYDPHVKIAKSYPNRHNGKVPVSVFPVNSERDQNIIGNNEETNVVNDSVSNKKLENKISNHTRISSPEKMENTTRPHRKRSIIKINSPKNMKKKRTSLKVNLSAAFKSKTEISDMSPSRWSVKEKVSKKKVTSRTKQNQSPKLSSDSRSSQTEVAILAPSSISKPYYEAWVNTTLAAVSKNSEIDKLLLEKQNLFQKTESPELAYDLTDERFLGRIKVRQR